MAHRHSSLVARPLTARPVVRRLIRTGLIPKPLDGSEREIVARFADEGERSGHEYRPVFRFMARSLDRLGDMGQRLDGHRAEASTHVREIRRRQRAGALR